MSANALAQRLIVEGLQIAGHPRIQFRDGAGGRRAVLAGTRLDVWQVIETFEQNDKSLEDTASYLDIPVEHVRSAIAFYADNRESVDTFAERIYAIGDNERKSFERQQEVLA